MPFYTPLRYPGGKRRLAPAVKRLLEANKITDVQYVEPYAGGASIALTLLLEEHASTIYINDLSRSVYAFWYAVLNETAELCKRIERVKITMREWQKQRAVYDHRDTADLIDLGFASLFLNRTNRSGIIHGGVIGGKEQSGKWSLSARFNKNELIYRIRRIGRYTNRIHLYQLDALEFVKRIIPDLGGKYFFFFDPPYIENGDDLYLNDYTLDDHHALASYITKVRLPWIITYDCAAIRENLYQTNRRIIYGLSYSAQSRYEGREVMYLSNHLKLPDTWLHTNRILLSEPNSRYPLYGIKEELKP